MKSYVFAAVVKEAEEGAEKSGGVDEGILTCLEAMVPTRAVIC